MSRPPRPPRERDLIVGALLFYGAMAALALLALAGAGRDLTLSIFGTGQHVGRDTIVGAAAGLGVVALTYVTRELGPIKRLDRELSALLGDPSGAAIALIATASAIGEELLFRGALQPWLGLWLTSGLFGLLHGGTDRRLYIWAIFATLAGLLLGWLAEFTGGLLAPILCHLTVNFWNLHLMATSPHDSGPA